MRAYHGDEPEKHFVPISPALAKTLSEDDVLASEPSSTLGEQAAEQVSNHASDSFSSTAPASPAMPDQKTLQGTFPLV